MCAVLSRVQLFATPWTVARQAPLSMEFARQEYLTGLPFPPPGDLPDPVDGNCVFCNSCFAGRFFTTVPPGKPHLIPIINLLLLLFWLLHTIPHPSFPTLD